MWSEKQPTAKGEHLFLDEHQTVELVVYRQNKLGRLGSDLGKCIHLKMLDLSQNNIVQVPETTVWSGLKQLQYLNLSHNKIRSWESVVSMSGCPCLSVLVLSGNPVSTLDTYRHFVLNQIHTLECLDGQVVVDPEVIEGLNQNNVTSISPVQMQQKSSHSSSSSSSSDDDAVAAGEVDNMDNMDNTADAPQQASQQDLETKQHKVSRFSYAAPETFVSGLYIGSKDSASYAVNRFNFFLRTIHLKRTSCSALVCLQSFARQINARRFVQRHLVQGPKAATAIQSSVRGFLVRTSVEDELNAILMASESGLQLMITGEDRARKKSAVLIQRAYRESELWMKSFGSGGEENEMVGRSSGGEDDGEEKEYNTLNEHDDPDLTSMDMESMSPMHDRNTTFYHRSGSGNEDSRQNSSDGWTRNSSKLISPMSAASDIEMEELSKYEMGIFSKELRRIESGSSLEDDIYDDMMLLQEEEDRARWGSRPSTALPAITITKKKKKLAKSSATNTWEEDNDGEIVVMESSENNLLVAGQPVIARRPMTAYEETKYQRSELAKRSKEESMSMRDEKMKRWMASIKE